MRLWPHQQRGIKEVLSLIESGERRICMTSPTGGGKTVMMRELIDEYLHRGKKVALYTNRVILTNQTSSVLAGFDVRHGIRASGFQPELYKDVQICSLMTEHVRCIKRQSWDLHPADLVLVDEAHAQKAVIATNIFNRHVAAGSAVVGVTATPLGIGHLYDHLVVAGTNSELRQCGAHVPCVTYGPDEPDLRHIGRTKTGEFRYKDIVKNINHSSLFGRVVKWWRILNPYQRPSILFAPGVSESKWFVDQFALNGITAAHIDGRHIYVNGREHQSTPELRAQILEASKTGEIKILCNRFVLREGVDAPWLFHCIMATPFGSLTSFLQAGGRLLRSSKGLTEVILQDHGGNWWRHGSLNEDRKWDLSLDELSYTASREAQRKEAQEREPICCVECGFIRLSGSICPSCGHENTFRHKNVLQIDGTIKRMTATDYKKSRTKRQHSEAQKAWYNCFFALLKASQRGGGNRTKMGEVAAYYKRKMGTWPDPSMNGVPKNKAQWSMTVQEYHKAGLAYTKQ